VDSLDPSATDGSQGLSADYAAQLQELHDHKRAWAQTRALEVQADEAISHLRATAIALDAQLASFDNVDWHGLAAADPDQAQHLWGVYQDLKSALDDTLDTAAAGHQAHIAQAHSDHAERLAHGHAVLAQDLPGWSPELAAQLAAMGQTEFGFTPQELSEVHDPRLVKLLHRACVASIAAKGRDGVARHVQGQKTEPAQAVRGGSARAVAADTPDFAAFERLADAKLKRRD
jgi:hypothetical protein